MTTAVIPPAVELLHHRPIRRLREAAVAAAPAQAVREQMVEAEEVIKSEKNHPS